MKRSVNRLLSIFISILMLLSAFSAAAFIVTAEVPTADGVFDEGYTVDKMIEASCIYDVIEGGSVPNTVGQYVATYYYWDDSYIYFFIDVDDPGALSTTSDVFYLTNAISGSPYFDALIVFNNLAEKTDLAGEFTSYFGKKTENGRQYEIIVPRASGQEGFTFNSIVLNQLSGIDVKVVSYNFPHNSPGASQKVSYADDTTWSGSSIDPGAPLNMAAKRVKVRRVISAINRIGTVTAESGSLIRAARDAYNALPDEDTKALITNYATLTEAEEIYAGFSEPGDPVADGIFDEEYSIDKMTEHSWYYDVLNGGTLQNTGGKYISTYYYWDDEHIYFFVDIIDPGAPAYTQDAFYFSNTLGIAENNYFDELLVFDVNAQQITLIGTVTSVFGKTTEDGRQYEIIIPRGLENEGFIFGAAIAYAPETQVEAVVSYGMPFNSPGHSKQVLYDHENTWWDSNIDPDATVVRAAAGVPAKRVTGTIDAIGKVTSKSGKRIKDARDTYDALSAQEKLLVGNYSVLEAAEKTYADILVIEDVIKKINEIGAVTKASGDAIKAARDAYDALPDENTKALVTNYETLTSAEALYDQMISVVYGDINGDGDVTASDALLALQHSVKKIVLDENQLIAADVDTKTGVTAADALLILQFAVKKIPSFPIEAEK